MKEPLEAIDFSTLSVADRAEVDELRRAYEDEGKEAFLRALAVMAKNNSALFMRLVAALWG